MFISIHLPKTAGTSLRTTLEEAYGNRLYSDYGDKISELSVEAERIRARNKKRQIAKIEPGTFDYDIIHGHFWARKYLDVFNVTDWITCVRDPMTMLPSLYSYLHRREDSTVVVDLAKSLSFEEFVEHSWFQNMMTRNLAPLKFEDFTLVATTEDQTTSIRRLARILNRELVERRTLINPNKGGYEISDAAKRTIARFNEADIGLFRRATENLAGLRMREHSS